MDAEEWIAQYDRRLTEIASRAKEAESRLREVGGSATSPRGEVRVRVGASGVLEDLTLTAAARTLESHELARLILDTTRTARHEVSARIAGISAECFGEGPALEEIKRHLPAGVSARRHDEDDYFTDPPEITR